MAKTKYIGNKTVISAKTSRVGGKRRTPIFTVEQLREFKPILKFLNERDRDILYLIFVTCKRQKNVQKILGQSQPSLCYYIRRIRFRLKFITYLNSISDIFFDFVSDSKDFSDEEREIMTVMFLTTSYTQTAKILNIRQKKVSYMFNKIIERSEADENWQIYEILMAIRRNLNIVKRVYTPYDNGRQKLSDIFVPV